MPLEVGGENSIHSHELAEFRSNLREVDLPVTYRMLHRFERESQNQHAAKRLSMASRPSWFRSPFCQQHVSILERRSAESSGELSKAATTRSRVKELFNQNKYVEARINYLVRDLFLQRTCGICCRVLHDGLRSSCVVGMALPLASCIVLLCFRLMGIPLHQMSS